MELKFLAIDYLEMLSYNSDYIILEHHPYKWEAEHGCITFLRSEIERGVTIE